MGLFSGIFGTPQTTQNTPTSGTKRSVFSSGKDTVTLTKGEVVKGEVTDLRSNEVTIRLDDGKTLHAKLNTAMELSIGQKAEFFVQETNDVLITLKLLSDGDTSFTESAIDKALEAAGFPKSANAANIVRSLLNAGLPANKEMIQKMMQHSAANKDVELSTLTALLKNNLPVTKENATQLQSYRNFEHRLVGQAATLTSALTEALQLGEAAPEFTKGLLAQFFGEGSQNVTEGFTSAPLAQGETLASAEGVSVFSSAGITPSTEATTSASAAQSVAPFSQEAKEVLLQAEHLSSTLAEALDSNASVLGGNTQTTGSVSVQPPTQLASRFEESAPLKSILTEAEYQRLGDTLAKLPSDSPEFQILNQDYTNNTLSANQLFSAFSKHANTHSAADIASLFKEDPTLSSLLEQTLLGRFVLTPEDLTKEDAVKDFYEQTKETLSSLTDLANAFAGESDALKNAADVGAKMQDNIQFMNTLNQLFPYVQLPLKLTEQLTHGELYVYAKKKDLSAETKEVSILLHLDMDSLGPTDVHLTLLQQNVTAKFYLTDTDAQSLVSEELPSLTEALRKKGYSLNAQVMKREKEPDIVNDFMDGGESVSMKRFRFDIRA
ncbi:MAG: flagellar hook-length control protein FliK [Lachnospiraceae bacterium]|nr:flagellar hook-length control protein FliK [Lachnospiraceae bacterium]